MSLVASAKEQISKVTDASLREKFEDALRQSYVWNGISNDKPPLSAESIVDASGISAEALEGKGILLGKRGIARYASEIGESVTESAIRKKITKSKYEIFFRREYSDNRKCVKSGRKLVFTFAEVRCFFKVRSRGEIS